jgi:hypothetical protein
MRAVVVWNDGLGRKTEDEVEVGGQGIKDPI